MGMPSGAPAAPDGEQWSVSVHLQKGKVAAQACGLVDLSPSDIVDVLRLPDGARIFRVERREPLPSDDEGCLVEDVTFQAPIRVLFWKAWARTTVRQIVDARDPQRVIVRFRLLHSDLMSHLEGGWELQQQEQPNPGAAVTTQLRYSFTMWPKGVPRALRFLPGLMDAVCGSVAKEAAQLCDKVAWVASKVRPDAPDVVRIAQALRAAGQDVDRAGGSFKKHRRLQEGGSQQLQDALAPGAAAAAAGGAAELSASEDSAGEDGCDDDEATGSCDACGAESDSDGSCASGSPGASAAGSCWDALVDVDGAADGKVPLVVEVARAAGSAVPAAAH